MTAGHQAPKEAAHSAPPPAPDAAGSSGAVAQQHPTTAVSWDGPKGTGTHDGELAGPAFPALIRTVAGLCFLGCLGWFLLLWARGQLGRTQAFAMNDAVITAITVLALMAVLVVHMQISQTRINAQQVTQSWLWAKEVRVAELADVRLIHLSGLAGWLVAPRAYCRTISGRNIVIHAADPAVLAAIGDLQRFVRARATGSA